MGNEHSKSKDLTKNGKNPEKHKNGSVNGLSANITSNGLEVEVNGETILQQNGGPQSLDPPPEPAEPDYVIVSSNCQQTEAPVISEILETVIPKEEVKKNKEEKVRVFGKMFKKKAEPPAEVKSAPETEPSNEDQPDVSLPATDPQPELGSSGKEVATVTIAEQRDNLEHQKVETSTQTDRKKETDISTQTGGEDGANTTTKIEFRVEEVVTVETTEEHLVNDVIPEEVVEETKDEEPFDRQPAGIITEEVVTMENNVYENTVFRAERVEITDNFETNHIKNDDPEEEDLNKTEPEVAVEESNPSKYSTEGETVAEENNVEETAHLEMSCSLPKVVADSIEALFAAVPESTDITPLNTSEPSVGEVIAEDNREGARDTSADTVLIETVEPEANIPSLDEEPVTTVLETVSEIVCEVPNPIPANQDMSFEAVVKDDAEVIPETAIDALSQELELYVTPHEPEVDIAITLEEEVIVAQTYVPLSGEQEASPTIPEEASEAVAEEMIEEAIEALSDELEAVPESTDTTVQEPSTAGEVTGVANEAEQPIIKEDTTVQELSTGGEVTEVGSEAMQETVAEEEISTRDIIEVTSMFEETVAEKTGVSEDVLVQDETGKRSPVVSDEPVEDNPRPCEDDATTEVFKNMLESVVDAISEKLEATEIIIEELVGQPDVPQMDTTGEPETSLSVQEELIEENISQAERLLEDVIEDRAAPSEIAVTEPTESCPVILEKPLDCTAHPHEPQVLVVIIETNEDEVTENTQDIAALPAIDENSDDSQTEISNKSVSKCVKAVLETIVEEIVLEEVVAECNLVASVEEAPEIIIEVETEQKADNSTGSLQSAEVTEDTTATSPDMEALLARLQSACTSAIEESAFKLDSLKICSLGYNITFIIHVALK